MEAMDLILRSMAATQLLTLALLLLWRSGSLPALRFAAMLPLGLAAFAATSTRGADLGPMTTPLTLLCLGNPVWFWVFTEALFDDRFALEGRHLAVLAAVWVVGGWHELAMPSPPQGPVHWLFTALVVGVLVLALLRLLRERAGDLVETRRRWRVWFVASVAAYGLTGLALLAFFGGQLPAEWARAHMALLFVVATATSLALVAAAAGRSATPQPRQPEGPASARDDAAAAALRRRGEPRSSLPAEEALSRRIQQSMEAGHLYRQENLTVAGLAKVIGSQEYLVRRAINGSLGYRNFNDFLHHYRLGEAAPRLLSQRHLPVLSIALDVGYGSIGPFNRAFRERFGTTPTAYRARPPSGADASASTAAIGTPRDLDPKTA